MKLKQSLLKVPHLLDDGFQLPTYDVSSLRERTFSQPTWLHLGAGNIFRAFLGSCQQQLLNQGQANTGIIVAEGYDFEIVDVLNQYEQLTVNVTLKESGEVDKEIVASIVDYLKMDPEHQDFLTIQEVMKASTLQMVSLTITEKGYSLTDNHGKIQAAVSHDFIHGPSNPTSYLGKLASFLVDRFEAGAFPLALVSMDNMSHNGEKLQHSIRRFVDEWASHGLVDDAFVEYVKTSGKITFPWSMIDKITPRPDQQVQQMLEEAGLEEMTPHTTAKHTYVAPYVNGEETQYLIIEDEFPNGRPPLEKVGIQFTTRETVNAVETMKVTTCLNPLHTALAIYGCLLGYTSIHEEMKDEALVGLIKRLGYQEGLPVVTNPKIIDPKAFIDEVIDVRLPNPFIPDTPQRIATDTSQKLPVRFGETIKAYQKANLAIDRLEAIPFVFAGWLRYLTGVNDHGETFQLSQDPFADQIVPIFANFSFGEQPVTTELKQLLANKTIFGVDLFEVGLANQVMSHYQALSQAPGAIREAIDKFK